MNVEEQETENTNTPNVVTKKRGRKSKKELLELEKSLSENINVQIVVTKQNNNNSEPIQENKTPVMSPDIADTNQNNSIETMDDSKLSIAKKRGRKPKGGKIVQQIVSINDVKEAKPNVILHLKCSSKDLINNISKTDTLDIESYNFGSKNELSYEVISNNVLNEPKNEIISHINDIHFNNETENTSCKTKEISNKLKQLKHNLHVNNISDKKSACFWCTFDFDNQAVYIPKHYIKESYHVYGCFCSPECAVAYLMDENIDSSIKFERYHFLNHIYAKIFDYDKNIKPAPNPYYMLDKYYGNLSIQEYRSLLRNERLFLIVDKPLTRILPELHEDNDEFILNNKIIPSNTLQLKKKIQKKGQNKNNIVNEHFGIASTN